MNKDKIVLSFPFSGALYAFIDHTLLDKRYSTHQHGYYTWLFGKNPMRWRSLALTLLILYPEIILVPRDHPMPHRDGDKILAVYDDSDLGIKVDMDDFRKVNHKFDEQVQEDLRDLGVQQILRQLRIRDGRFLLYDLHYEIYLAQKHNARIVCARGRKRLINYLIQRNQNKKAKTETSQKINFANQYVKLSHLKFDFDDIDLLYAVKEDKHVIQYAEVFRTFLNERIISNKPSSIDITTLTQEAYESSELARIYAQTSEIVARVMSWSGLFLNGFPFIGIVSTASQMGVESAGRHMNKKAMEHDWVDFAPQIDAAKRRYIYKHNLKKK